MVGLQAGCKGVWGPGEQLQPPHHFLMGSREHRALEGSLSPTFTASTPWALADTQGGDSPELRCHELPPSPSGRRKQLYLSLDIEQLLANEGIDSDKLMPRHPDPRNPQTIEQGHDPLFPIYLPLKVSPASTES